MHVMIKAEMPPDKSVEAGKAYVSFLSKGLPKGVRLLETYVIATKQGIESYTIYRIKDENFVQAYKELQESYVVFHNIVGYRYKIDIVLTTAEAFPMVGLKPPGG